MHTCIPSHGLKRSDVHVLDTQKHTQHASSTKTDCDYLNGWIKLKKTNKQQQQQQQQQQKKPKPVTYQHTAIRKNLTENGEPQRYSWRTQEEKKKKKEKRKEKKRKRKRKRVYASASSFCVTYLYDLLPRSSLRNLASSRLRNARPWFEAALQRVVGGFPPRRDYVARVHLGGVGLG